MDAALNTLPGAIACSTNGSSATIVDRASETAANSSSGGVVAATAAAAAAAAISPAAAARIAELERELTLLRAASATPTLMSSNSEANVAIAASLSATTAKDAPVFVPYVADVAEWDSMVSSNPGTVIAVQFSAVWCGPCKQLGPVFAELSTQETNLLCRKVDVDDNDEITAKCKVEQMPMVQFYKDGKKIFQFTGDKQKLLREKMGEYNRTSVAPRGAVQTAAPGVPASTASANASATIAAGAATVGGGGGGGGGASPLLALKRAAAAPAGAIDANGENSTGPKPSKKARKKQKKKKKSADGFHNPPKAVFKPTAQALAHFGMINDGDRVLVCLSGGKDSLSMLHTLRQYQHVSKSQGVNFTLAAATVDPGTDAFDPSPLKGYVASLGLPYFYEEQAIIDMAQAANASSICSFCSRMKRGRLYHCARREGYNVLAFGQHLDDLAESFMMAAFHNGFLRTMKANYTVDGGDLRVIRPFVFVRERDLRSFAERVELPVIAENCPGCFEAPKERHRTKQLLASQEILFPQLFNSLQAAMMPLMSVDRTGSQSRQGAAVATVSESSKPAPIVDGAVAALMKAGAAAAKEEDE